MRCNIVYILADDDLLAELLCDTVAAQQIVANTASVYYLMKLFCTGALWLTATTAFELLDTVIASRPV